MTCCATTIWAAGFARFRKYPARCRGTSGPPSGIQGFEDDADSGGYPDADVYLAEFSYRIGHPITRQHWIAARRESMIPSSDVLALAEAIGKISRLAIYTNNGPIVKSSLDELFPEAAAIFKERYCSYEFGTKKPDPDSFTKLLATIKISPADTWFIDDKRSNVQGAGSRA